MPTRVAFFSWTAILGRILTIDNLWKRRVLILDWCCMCKSHGESVNYLLLHCPIAQELWNLIFTLFGTLWVMPRGVDDLFACWSGKVGNSESRAIWKAVPHCPCGAYCARETLELSLGRSNRFQLSNSPSLQTLFE